MTIKHNGSLKLRIFGTLTVIFALLELILCFKGPIAFVPKPSLILFPVVSSNLTLEESASVSTFIEREMARINSYAIRSQSFLEEYLPEQILNLTYPDLNRTITLRPLKLDGNWK